MKVCSDGLIRLGTPEGEKLQKIYATEPTGRQRLEAAISVFGTGAEKSNAGMLMPLMWPRRDFKPYEANNAAFNLVRGVLLQLLEGMPLEDQARVVQEATEDQFLES